jgi:DNA polymerase-3 subunit delta'
MLIIDYLTSRFKLGKLYNSWLISTENNSKALLSLQAFIQNNLLIGSISLEHHPDFKLIERYENAKNISIEQIRDLKEFLYKTSATAPYNKVIVICGADLMTINGANACLSMLEDSTKNTYIFLITENASKILSTIRSRCAKIRTYSDPAYIHDSYNEYIASLLNINFQERLRILEHFTDKNRAEWLCFADCILYLINRIIKKSVNIDLQFTKLENSIIGQLHSTSPIYLIEKFDLIINIIHNTTMLDLDLRTSSILLMHQFNS